MNLRFRNGRTYCIKHDPSVSKQKLLNFHEFFEFEEKIVLFIPVGRHSESNKMNKKESKVIHRKKFKSKDSHFFI